MPGKRWPTLVRTVARGGRAGRLRGAARGGGGVQAAREGQGGRCAWTPGRVLHAGAAAHRKVADAESGRGTTAEKGAGRRGWGWRRADDGAAGASGRCPRRGRRGRARARGHAHPRHHGRMAGKGASGQIHGHGGDGEDQGRGGADGGARGSLCAQPGLRALGGAGGLDLAPAVPGCDCAGPRLAGGREPAPELGREGAAAGRSTRVAATSARLHVRGCEAAARARTPVPSGGHGARSRRPRPSEGRWGGPREPPAGGGGGGRLGRRAAPGGMDESPGAAARKPVAARPEQGGGGGCGVRGKLTLNQSDTM
jgi:hypothetical protein